MVTGDDAPTGPLTDAQLLALVGEYHRQAALGSPEIFLVYAQSFSSPNNTVSRTYQEYGIVLSDQQLLAATGGGAAAMAQDQTAALLHEFGTQLGLPTSSDPSCIMDPLVETPAHLSVVPADYCQAELNEVAQLKN